MIGSAQLKIKQRKHSHCITHATLSLSICIIRNTNAMQTTFTKMQQTKRWHTLGIKSQKNIPP